MAEPILVIDLSHHQGGSISKVDGLRQSHWKALKKCGVKAAIIKASQGTGHVDEDAAIHVQRARANGMEVGLYHFADGSSGTTQADHFIAAAKRVNGGTLKDLLLVIDVERNPDPAGTDAKGPHVRAMARRLAEKAPRNALLIYTAEGYWRAIGNADMAAEVDGLWQARWDGRKHLCRNPNLPASPPRAGFGGWAGRPPLWQFGRLRYTVGKKQHGIDGSLVRLTREAA